MADEHDDSGYQSNPSRAGTPQPLSKKDTGTGPPSANTRKRTTTAPVSVSKRLKSGQSDRQDTLKGPKASFQPSNTAVPSRDTPSSMTRPSVAHPLSAAATPDADTGTPSASASDPSKRALFGALMKKQWGEGGVIRDALRTIVSLQHNTFAAEPFLLGTEKKDLEWGVAEIDAKEEGLVLLCPVRCEDYHWVLIEARPGARTARIYDSRPDCPTVQSAVDEILSRLDVLVSTQTSGSPWPTTQEACAEQMHKDDDGIAVIANAFCALSGSAPEGTLDSRAWRHSVAAFLEAVGRNDVAGQFDERMKEVTFESIMDRSKSSSESLPALPDLKGADLDPKDAVKHIEQLREYSEAVKKQGLSATNAAQRLLNQHLQNVRSQQTIMGKLVDLGKATLKDLQAGEASIKTKIEETWQALGEVRDNANAEWAEGRGQSLDCLISDRREKSKAAFGIMKVFDRLAGVLTSLQSRADIYDKVAKEVKVYQKKLEAA
ncbi:hypothetical protein COL26b_014401 [Colletotrichum chrysophilum]|uniref:uncharacterized protein n=1 Tax=Colletotrichum chrysophilum TaxID=1836956 RepID=UPI0023016FF0|nr:uncharacterized protein COL26b_014401 [Colletotrichum chrysophilum]KAJ0359170.1 hypothetical protein COL26b_014401 [Colletotrichum chrysophilum]